MLVVVNKALLIMRPAAAKQLHQYYLGLVMEVIMIGYWGSLLELDAWNVMNAIICDDKFMRLYSWVILCFQCCGLFIILKFGMLQQEESDVGLPGGNGQLITLGLGLLATALAAVYVTKLAKVIPARAIFLYLIVWIWILLEMKNLCLCPKDKRELAPTCYFMRDILRIWIDWACIESIPPRSPYMRTNWENFLLWICLHCQLMFTFEHIPGQTYTELPRHFTIKEHGSYVLKLYVGLDYDQRYAELERLFEVGRCSLTNYYTLPSCTECRKTIFFTFLSPARNHLKKWIPNVLKFVSRLSCVCFFYMKILIDGHFFVFLLLSSSFFKRRNTIAVWKGNMMIKDQLPSSILYN